MKNSLLMKTIQMTGNAALNTTQFVHVVSDKELKEHGLYKGDILMIVAFKQVPIQGDDPYLSRHYALAARFVDNVLQLPAEDNEYRIYLIDPRNVEYVGDDEQLRYEEMLNEQYGESDTSG